jgi:predicted MPP superfamily phosphohydrolase
MRPGFLISFLIALALYVAIHYYLWTRLVRSTALPPPWPALLSVALVLLALSMPALFVSTRFFGMSLGGVFWGALGWSAVAIFLLLFLSSADLARTAADLLGRLGSGPGPDPERRLFLSRLVAGGASGLSLGLVGFGMRSALAGPRVRPVRVSLARLPRALSGTTLVQLTDLHIGRGIHRAYVEDVVARANALEPDIVAITGDLADGTPAHLGDDVRPLGELRARHGVYFVTGNHDHYSGAEPWIDFIGELGIRTLRNEHVVIGDGDNNFVLAGVDDPAARMTGRTGPDVGRALAGVAPDREIVLLAHRPTEIYAATEHGVGLQLSGHTHGGQFWPFTWAAHLVFPYVAGLANHDGTQIYVSRGTGYVGPPVRIGAPAELTLVELTRDGTPAV